MAIVGSIEDGLKGNPSILYLKSVMDGVITVVFVTSLGRGAVFSVARETVRAALKGTRRGQTPTFSAFAITICDSKTD